MIIAATIPTTASATNISDKEKQITVENKTEVNHFKKYKNINNIQWSSWHHSWYKESSRRKDGERPGLDFKYSVVIRDESFIGEDGHIDLEEIKFLTKNEKNIIYQYLRYIKDYKKYVSNPISKFWDSWRFSHTSLEYFWDEMGFEVDDKELKKREIEISYCF